MLNIPDYILPHYEAILKKKIMDVSRHADFKKWLRYFLDFCNKYLVPDSRPEQVRLFTEKLREKKQTADQLKQAAYAVSLYFEILRRIDNKTPLAQINTEKTLKATSPSTPFIKGESSNNLSRVAAIAPIHSVPPPSAGKRFNEWRCLAKSKSPAWDKIIDTLTAEIKTRHYSRKTLKAYAIWSRQFQKFLKNKQPMDCHRLMLRNTSLSWL